MNEVDITFGIPMYNSEKYIEELLDCFVETKKFSYEIIIVNDGSTDNSLKKIKNLKLKNLKIIDLIKNEGVSSARNYIIKNSNGRWLTFIDSDDLINFDKFIEIFEEIKDRRSDYIICINSIKEFKNIERKKNKISYIIEKSLINSPWQKFYEVDVLKKNNILFDTNISIGEDALFNMNYLYYSSNIQFYFSDFYKYRNINENSLSKKFDKDKFENLMYVNECSKKFTKNVKEKKALEYIRILNCRGCIFEMIKFKDIYNTYKMQYSYVKRIKSYKNRTYFFLNGIKQTITYYSWYMCPNFILPILGKIYYKLKNKSIS